MREGISSSSGIYIIILDINPNNPGSTGNRNNSNSLILDIWENIV